MKGRLLMLFCVCSATLSYAQVGINTEDPQGMLHVKGTVNDVIVEEGTGNVGIGTLNPTEKVHVVGDVKSTGIQTTRIEVGNSSLVGGRTNVGTGTANNDAKVEIVSSNAATGMRIEGNTNPDNYYLTSDGDGVGNWKYLRPNTSIKEGIINNAVSINTSYTLISNSLSLETGKWLIFVNGVIRNTSTTAASHFVEMVLRENGTDLYDVGIVPRYATGSATIPKIANPQITAIVHIESGTNTYSVFAKASTSGYATYQSATYGQLYFLAVKLDDQ